MNIRTQERNSAVEECMRALATCPHNHGTMRAMCRVCLDRARSSDLTSTRPGMSLSTVPAAHAGQDYAAGKRWARRFTAGPAATCPHTGRRRSSIEMK